MEKTTNTMPVKPTAAEAKEAKEKVRRDNLAAFFADGSIPPDEKSYFSQLLNKKAPFGEKAARRIEADYGMDPGYLDRNPSEQPADRPSRSVEPSTMATLATSIVQTTLMMAGLPKNLLGEEAELRAMILQRKARPKGITADQVRKAFVEMWVEEAENVARRLGDLVMEAENLEVMAGVRGHDGESTEDARRRMGQRAAETLLKKINEL